jgi:lipopolysaccharide transport system permease protein
MKWDLSVSSEHRLLDFNFREIVRYRDLILTLFYRDFTTTYRQTILGPLWHIVSPLCQTIVFAFVFSNIAGMSTDGVPALLFYFGGTMLWAFFSTSLNNSSGIFINNFKLFGKVYFPRLVVIIASSFSALLRLFIQFLILMVFLFYYINTGNPVRPTMMAFLLPFLVIWMALLGTGCGMIFSSFTAKYRDLNLVLGLVMQLAMYVTPVVYPLSSVPREFRFMYYINPVSAPIELFRMWFFGVGETPLLMIIISLVFTVLAMFVGLILFSRTSRTFMDVI